MALPLFDNHDSRIKYYELLLERGLGDLPAHDLPAGYRFALYKEGDRDKWIAIEQSAKELTSYEQGLEVWEKYYGGKDEALKARMVFLVTEDGEYVGTATAFYDVTGRDTSGAGWLHWVAVKREHQSKGLSKPLIVHTLSIMKELGYTHAKIPTQTTTWVACKVYLDLGFMPIPANAVHSAAGWQIIRRLTDHPALGAFPPAADGAVMGEEPCIAGE